MVVVLPVRGLASFGRSLVLAVPHFLPLLVIRTHKRLHRNSQKRPPQPLHHLLIICPHLQVLLPRRALPPSLLRYCACGGALVGDEETVAVVALSLLDQVSPTVHGHVALGGGVEGEDGVLEDGLQEGEGGREGGREGGAREGKYRTTTRRREGGREGRRQNVVPCRCSPGTRAADPSPVIRRR